MVTSLGATPESVVHPSRRIKLLHVRGSNQLRMDIINHGDRLFAMAVGNLSVRGSPLDGICLILKQPSGRTGGREKGCTSAVENPAIAVFTTEELIGFGMVGDLAGDGIVIEFGADLMGDQS